MCLQGMAAEEPYILRVGLLLNMTGMFFYCSFSIGKCKFFGALQLLIFSVDYCIHSHKHLKCPTILLYDFRICTLSSG